MLLIQQSSNLFICVYLRYRHHIHRNDVCSTYTFFLVSVLCTLFQKRFYITPKTTNYLPTNILSIFCSFKNQCVPLINEDVRVEFVLFTITHQRKTISQFATYPNYFQCAVIKKTTYHVSTITINSEKSFFVLCTRYLQRKIKWTFIPES